jgi:hypothetical protein
VNCRAMKGGYATPQELYDACDKIFDDYQKGSVRNSHYFRDAVTMKVGCSVVCRKHSNFIAVAHYVDC